MPFNTVDA